MAAPATIPRRATIVALRDVAVEARGFHPTSEYFEWVYLPLIGPSSCLLYRHVAPLIVAADRVVVDLVELGRSLGLGSHLALGAPLAKTMARLEAYDLARWRPGGEYALRRAVPAVSDRQARRLPQPARGIHYRITQPPAGGSAVTR